VKTGAGIQAIVITGPVGAGKSTTAAEVSRLLEGWSVRHALFDMDYLRWVYPSPEGDPFAAALGMENLAAIWPNVVDVGVSSVILADVVESRNQTSEYERAMPGAVVRVVRLDVPIDQIAPRLKERETEETIEWYLKRAPELQGIMDREGVGDIVIDVGTRSATEVALEIIERTGIGRETGG
jgi:adenylylsulfate kinase